MSFRMRHREFIVFVIAIGLVLWIADRAFSRLDQAQPQISRAMDDGINLGATEDSATVPGNLPGGP